MAKKKALGRGLSALLENSGTSPEPRKPISKGSIGNVAGNIAMLKISQIEANPFQPRSKFDSTALEELATSIRELGIIQPITVRKIGAQRYQLISGERRFRASQIAEVEEIPSYVREADDQAMLEMALVENIQRENLDAIEVAISYQRLIDECSLTQEQLSERVGKNRTTVTNYLRLLKLPAEIQVGIIEKEISMGHARALVNAGSEKKQVEVFRKILKDDLSVRQTEELVRDSGQKAKSKNGKPAGNSLSLAHQKVRDELKEKFGKGAGLKRSENGTGKIEIPFRSEDELQQLIDLLEL